MRCVAMLARRNSRSQSNVMVHRCGIGAVHLRNCLVRTMTSTAVYAIGEGWMGALGTGDLDQSVAGHADHISDAADPPVLMFESRQHRVLSCDVGWGHSAFVIEDIEKRDIHDANSYSVSRRKTVPISQTTNTSMDVDLRRRRTQLLVTGRPHEFSSLLRLHRLPRRLRQYAVHQTFRGINRTGKEPSPSSNSFNPDEWIGRAITYLTRSFGANRDQDWETAREHSFLVVPTAIDVPDSPIHVSCNAGITAVTTESGAVYTFGLNGMGQCGIGHTSNNVWTPTRVTGLSREFAIGSRVDISQSYAIQQTALGLQHGLCLNVEGELFSWGKGERGQLGHDAVESESHSAMPIHKAVTWEQWNEANETLVGGGMKLPKYHGLGKISHIAAGMIHSAALEEISNHVYIWGKNTLPLLPGRTEKGKVASDARMPVRLYGLPKDRNVLKVSCGSHHTSVLLDDGSVWAVGVATDSKRPVHTPTCLIEPGIIDLTTMTQFAAHMDRTTVVFGEGQQVLQAHLWEDLEHQAVAVFTPSWVYKLFEANSKLRVREVHRSWLHTTIVTEES